MFVQKIINVYHFFQSILANTLYGFPSKKLYLIGITGTDGKTTTASLVYHMLRKNNLNAGLITTIGAKINDRDYSIGLHTTTPSPFLIQDLLARMITEKCLFAVLEVTSHAIDQNRIGGCQFRLGVLTNITHEHLDYHESFQNYLNTKVQFLNKCATIVINHDDNSYEQIRPLLHKPVLTYGLDNQSDYWAQNIKQVNEHQVFEFNGKQVSTKLLGVYNIYNILAAITCALKTGLKIDTIVSSINSFNHLPGRLEIITTKPFKVIIDFAHTPNAFQNILPTIKNITKGRIIHVFGATGKRDATKRPVMGKISGELADICILTSEDTYGENPQQIISEIEPGLKQTGKELNKSYFITANRKKAIAKALEIATDGDTILLTGVGHQTSLNLGDKELPWSEKEIVLELLKNR